MKKITFTLLLMLSTCYTFAQPKVIAHRGYWKTDGSAQNSIAALIKADSIACYGSEFDVWLVNDDELVVAHGPYQGLQKIETSSSQTLTNLTLKNGEPLPTLKQYLENGQKLQTRLILELKAHSSPQRETKAVQQIIEMVNTMKLQNRVEYITFSLHATREFIRLAPEGTPVYYLNGDLTPQQLKEIGCAGPDYNYKVFQKNPEWIAECHKLGLKVNAWTVNNEKDMKQLIELGIDFITTDEPEKLQQLIKNDYTR